MAKGRAEKFNDTHKKGRLAVDTASMKSVTHRQTTLQYMRQPFSRACFECSREAARLRFHHLFH